jgi:hypothetical protein
MKNFYISILTYESVILIPTIFWDNQKWNEHYFSVSIGWIKWSIDFNIRTK